MKNVLITGANSGLGSSFVKHYLQRGDATIFAVDRTFSNNTKTQLQALSLSHKEVILAEHDVSSERDMQQLAHMVKHSLSKSRETSSAYSLDLVIHSAGVRGLVPSMNIETSSGVSKAETMAIMDKDTLMKTFEINAAGTFMLIKSLLPLLRGNSREGDPAKVIVMGSRMGSISSNVSGGSYAYRASKAALNAIMSSFAIDVPTTVFVTVHPGRIETNLCNGVREDGAMLVDDVVPSLMDMIDAFGMQDSGRFVDRFGERIGW